MGSFREIHFMHAPIDLQESDLMSSFQLSLSYNVHQGINNDPLIENVEWVTQVYLVFLNRPIVLLPVQITAQISSEKNIKIIDVCKN